MKRGTLSLALAALGVTLACWPVTAQTRATRAPDPTHATVSVLPATSGRLSGGISGNSAGSVTPSAIDWAPIPGPTGGTDIRFHIRWQNTDPQQPSDGFHGTISSQEFGVFLPDYGPIGQFDVPPLQPSSFFDVFLEIPLEQLPPAPQKREPGPGGVAAAYGHQPSILTGCPPDTNWAGNVDIQWSGPTQGGQVNKHYSDLMNCVGGAPSMIHFRPSNCTVAMPWTVVGACPGFTVTLLNEDLSPAPNPVPVGWSGWISVTVGGAVPVGTTCCFGIKFGCAGAVSTVDICSTACQCQTTPSSPNLTGVDWTLTGTTVHFHQHWENPSSSVATAPVSGDMSSQPLGVFLDNYGPIGHFDLPPIAPSSFFDVFFDVDLSQLPPEPPMQVPGGTTSQPCFPQQWHGNVNIDWNGAGGTGQVFKHFGEMPVCPGNGPTYLFVETDCNSSTGGATWSISGLCPGWTATLVNLDHSPAPNPVPPGWVGQIAVSAAPGTPIGSTCCFKILFQCGGATGVIDVCAKACQCKRSPVLQSTDWTRIGSSVRFHMLWSNPDPSTPSDPVSGDMNSQPFGAFAQDAGSIGHFDVPPMPPSSFFDVFIEVPLSQLPPPPQQQLPGGGPPPGSPCPTDTSWSGNVDINWAGVGGTGQVNRHFTNLLVRPGSGSSHIHTLIFCNSTNGAAWTINGLCPGWSATLLNENFTPAPNPVPPGWTGWISVAAAGSVPSGASCCFSVTFVCDGHPGVIDVCAEACVWPVAGVPAPTASVDFGIYSTVPNPTRSGMAIQFAMPRGGHARLDLYTLNGQRVRTLFEGEAQTGLTTVRWDGLGENGRRLAPGAYFAKLTAGERISSKRIVMIR